MQFDVCCVVVSWLLVAVGGSLCVCCFVFGLLLVVSVIGVLSVACCLLSLRVVGWLSVVA